MKKLISIFLAIFFLWQSFLIFGVNTDTKNSIEDFAPKVLKDAGWDIKILPDTLNDKWADWIRDFLISIAKQIMMPLAIVVGLVMWFIAFYKLIFSDKEADMRDKAKWYFIWGVVGVIVMVSAVFLQWQIISETWEIESGTAVISKEWLDSPAKMAVGLYDKIISNFVWLFMYIAVWILFMLLLLSIIRIVTKWHKEEITKHASRMIVWNIIGIVTIITATNIVQLIYWKSTESAKLTGSLKGDDWILFDKELSWVHEIVNYFLSFLWIIITAFIIYQAFLLLVKPEDEATMKALRKNFVFVILGIWLMWWVYILSNFLIVK